jgi:conjugal transfer pilus assembly protein TraV
MIFMKKNQLFISSIVVLLAGCSVGQSEFSCSLGSDHSVCASSRTIYKATNGELAENETITYVEDGETKQITVSELQAIQAGDVDSEDMLSSDKTKGNSDKSDIYWSPQDGPKAIRQQRKEKEQRTEKVETKIVEGAVVKSEPKIPYQYGFDGDAIRTPVTVMRIWIAPFVDQQDNLRMSQVLFTDMEKKSWKIADTERQNFGVSPSAVIKKPSKVKEEESEQIDFDSKEGSIYIDPSSLQQIKTNFSNNGE